jgi:hypothetical protein
LLNYAADMAAPGISWLIHTADIAVPLEIVAHLYYSHSCDRLNYAADIAAART